MAIVKANSGPTDRDEPCSEGGSRPAPSEAEIERQAAEDGDAWTDEDFARAIVVYPPTKPEQIKALRTRLGLSQADFAHRFGFTIDTVQQYEQGRRTPSGPARTLLRVIEVDPDAVVRALGGLPGAVARNSGRRNVDRKRAAAPHHGAPDAD